MIDDCKERWVNVKDSEKYEVSNLGNIRNKNTKKILSPQENRHQGYLRVTLDTGRKYVHRIVADAFFDTDITGKEVNHIDGNKLNNTLPNLEVCSKRENIQHAMMNGLRTSSVVKVTRCKHCKCRGDFDICIGKPDDFYCSYGEQ